MRRAAELFEHLANPALDTAGELELAERAAPAPRHARSPGRSRCAPLRDESAIATAAGKHRAPRRSTAGTEQPGVAAADLTRIERAAEADHEQLPVTQGAGDLVGSGEQTAEAAGQGTERGGVGPADEADGSPGRRAQGQGDPPLREPEAARVDDDHRRAVGRQVLESTDAVAQRSRGEPLGDAGEGVVAAPVVDVPAPTASVPSPP